MSYLCLYLLVSWFVEVIVNLQDLSEVILMLNLYINLYLYLYIVEAEFSFQLCKEYSPLFIPMLYVISIYKPVFIPMYCEGGVHLPDA